MISTWNQEEGPFCEDSNILVNVVARNGGCRGGFSGEST